MNLSNPALDVLRAAGDPEVTGFLKALAEAQARGHQPSPVAPPTAPAAASVDPQHPPWPPEAMAPAGAPAPMPDDAGSPSWSRPGAAGSYTVLHGKRSLQMATDRLVVPKAEVRAFVSAVDCAETLTGLLEEELARVDAAVKAGRAEGMRQGRAYAHAVASRELATAVARMVERQQAQQVAARDAVGQVALGVVSRLSTALGAERIVPALIVQAVTDLMPETVTRVRVGPEVLLATQRRLHELGVKAEVRADESLGGFQCVIDSAQGRNVVSLENQLATLGKALGADLPVDIEL